ncbi:hypothetical protein M3201_24325 [Paenibacillus motobuensis]|uniref:hypothetical protein n=1 Tax=Paenibacillus TaxID=44249 RepID=UPI00203EA7B1|nr:MULTISPECIES: hypothetical protein [Paenibacillus]MCM3042788.1 hypothetical protein [Paenibacillus lutimineralis]MCM3649892.1 hypothetical protein [Paenibacillus motobuensis]
MNMQNVIKKTVLSAVMLSAAAAPGITHAADNAAKTVIPSVKTQAAAMVSMDGKSQNITIVKMADPLELAKQYAPETVEDWKQVLEQMGKVTVPAKTIDAKLTPVKSLSEIKISGDEQVNTLPVQASIAVFVSKDKATVAEDTSSKAWAALAKAEESKDATAIREALDGLLEQLKLVNAEREAAEE